MSKGKKLEMVKPPKGDALTRITQFMTGKTVVLNSDEEIILNRWIVCDGLMRQNRLNTDEICDQLTKQFSISKFTALSDIRNAQKLFAQARLVNKRYVGHLHLERINKDIEDTRERLFWYEDDDMPGIKKSRVPDAKELAALARLHQAYTDILNSMPEHDRGDAMPPPQFHFHLVGGEIKPTMDLDAALDAADAMLSGEDIPFEEIPNDQNDEDDE